jgi:hypothetical protein
MIRSLVSICSLLALWGVATCYKTPSSVSQSVSHSDKTPSQDADQSGHEGATIRNHQDGKSCNTDADQHELTEDAPSFVEVKEEGVMRPASGEDDLPSRMSAVETRLQQVLEKISQLEANPNPAEETCCVFQYRCPQVHVHKGQYRHFTCYKLDDTKTFGRTIISKDELASRSFMIPKSQCTMTYVKEGGLEDWLETGAQIVKMQPKPWVKEEKCTKWQEPVNQ